MSLSTHIWPYWARVSLSNGSRRLGSTRFHTHTRTLHRRQLKLRGPRQILWSYFTAPSNLLFVSTNLLGLTIAASWRSLSSLNRPEGVTDRNDGAVDANKSRKKRKIIGFDNGGDIKLKLTEFKKSILDTVDYTAFDESGSRHKTEGTFVSEDVELPWTETELNKEGSTRARDIKAERIENMIAEQLLYLYLAHDELAKMFENGVDMHRTQQLELGAKEELIRTLLGLIDTEERAISSFEDFMSRVPTEELRAQISAISPRTLLQTIQQTHENPILSYDQLEASQRLYHRHHTSAQIVPFLQSFKDVYDYSPDFLLSGASAVLNTNFNAMPYSLIFNQIGQEPQNINYQIFGNVLGFAMLKHSYIFTESHLSSIIQSAITSENKVLFNACLTKLRLTSEEAHPQTLIHKVTHGEQRHLSFAPYIQLLKGLMTLEYGENEVMKAVEKVLSGLRLKNDEVKIHVFNERLGMPQSKSNKLALKKIPLDLLGVVMNIAIKFENKKMLKWCLDKLDAKLNNQEIDQDVVHGVHAHLREIGLMI